MTIALLYPYLRYDAEQLISRYAFTREGSPEEVFEATLRSEESDEADLLRRYIDTACSRLHIALRKYVVNTPESASDKLRDDTAKDYTFLRSNADGQSIAELMHWFVVRHTLSAWCKQQGRYNEAEAEQKEAEDILQSLLGSLARSPMPMKEGKAIQVKDEIIIYYDTQNN